MKKFQLASESLISIILNFLVHQTQVFQFGNNFVKKKIYGCNKSALSLQACLQSAICRLSCRFPCKFRQIFKSTNFCRLVCRLKFFLADLDFKLQFVQTYCRLCRLCADLLQTNCSLNFFLSRKIVTVEE